MRQQLLSGVPGAGGFAGRTVPLSNPNSVVGYMGANNETNPIEVRDDTGSVIDFPARDGTYRPPHFEVVESWRRSTTQYPSPSSFRMRFQKPLSEVLAIEVLELNVPNVDAVVPPNREFLVLNGLLEAKDDGSYNFAPQRNLLDQHTFSTMVAHDSNDPSASYNTGADYLQYSDFALLRKCYDSTAPFQYWKREGWHRKTWFVEPVKRLDYLDLSLATVFGDPYDIADDEDWSMTLQVLCKQ